MGPAIYTALATAMFFLQDAYFSIGGMELSLKNPCALGIVFLALLNFIASAKTRYCPAPLLPTNRLPEGGNTQVSTDTKSLIIRSPASRPIRAFTVW